MTYTVQIVDPNTREYDTKYGPMVSYKVKFIESAETVEISQKPETPAPVPKQTMEGHIEETQYGHKFKKDYQSGGFTPRPQGSPKSTTGQSGSKNSTKFENSQFTMYLSYAKDLVVALCETGGYDQEKFEELLTATIKGGKVLYSSRPEAQDAAEAPAKVPESVSLLDGIEETIPEEELPWPSS